MAGPSHIHGGEPVDVFDRLTDVSAYPYWSLNFDLRADLPEHVKNVLSNVASDTPPDQADLAKLHPVVRFYLSDWRRMLVTENEPHVGSPVRLFRSWSADLGEADCLSIEFCQHDDQHANGGWVFWLWVLSLAHRPEPRPPFGGKSMIGYQGLYRGDHMAPQIFFVDAEGILFGETRITFEQVDESLGAASDDDFGYSSKLDS